LIVGQRSHAVGANEDAARPAVFAEFVLQVVFATDETRSAGAGSAAPELSARGGQSRTPALIGAEFSQAFLEEVRVEQILVQEVEAIHAEGCRRPGRAAAL